MDMKHILPPTTKRVELHTSKTINEKIERDTIDNLNRYKNANSKELSERIKELDREWDTERILEANAAGIILISTILGFTVNVYWFILIGIVSFFLLQHAVQGWCPPLPIIRRLGVRTQEEICSEKTVIKFLRGDFNKNNSNYNNLLDSIKE
ncbi:DUF2892 domain-containing protein [Clostridiaceae bacterium 35-E11]